MVKKTGGGNKHKKKKNHAVMEVERSLTFKEENQEYAQVNRLLGNCRLECSCFDGMKRLAHIRGTMRKKVWINVNDIILVSLRDFQDGKCDVLLKYSAKEVARLKSMQEIPETVVINEDTMEDKENDYGVDFEEEEEKEIDIDEI